MNIPRVRIIYSKFLDQRMQQLFEYRQAAGIIPADAVYPTSELIMDKVSTYQAAWEMRKPVLGYMQEILDLNFYLEVIDTYIVGQMKGAFSLPIVINAFSPPDIYIDTLTHEILHRLLSDNTQKVNTRQIISKMFPNETELCAVHIIVHALLKKIYLDFLEEPQRLIANKERDAKDPNYTRAWEIVESMGENKIITDFKSYYIV